jgi:hypothetical protein
MSELSPVYSEYEKVSSLFRRLNDATLVARQARLGLKTPSANEEAKVRHDLELALEELSENEAAAPNFSFSEIMSQLEEDDVDVSEQTLDSIRQRAKRGLRTLTNEDLEIIEKVTDALDSKSEMLFRRIQK